jgi:hypothetical protein
MAALIIHGVEETLINFMIMQPRNRRPLIDKVCNRFEL